MSYQDVFDLALGLKQGNGCEEVLHDALLEVGMPLTAFHFTGEPNGDFTHRMRGPECAVAAFLGQSLGHICQDTRYLDINWFQRAPFADELVRYKKEFLDSIKKEQLK